MEDLDKRFQEACNSIKESNISDTKLLLQLYGLYKQATVGNCNVPKPSFFNFTAKQKWEAWDLLKDLPQDEAKQQYIDMVYEIQPEKSSKSKATLGVAVSCLQNLEPEIEEDKKTIFDYVKEGNIDKVTELLSKNVDLAEKTDIDGLTLLHWAADRGDVKMIQLLAERKVNLDAIDESGQTALHYAYSCGHDECVRVLEGSGAKGDIKDNEGNLAKDVCL